jgi:hypothetical protein
MAAVAYNAYAIVDFLGIDDADLGAADRATQTISDTDDTIVQNCGAKLQ